MKKIIFAFIALFYISCAMADAPAQSQYKTLAHISTVPSILKSANYDSYKTIITVINATLEPIYFSVPGALPSKIILPNGYPNHEYSNDHILHPTYYGDTHVLITSANDRLIFDRIVCRRAILTVFALPGIYQTNIDPILCY